MTRVGRRAGRSAAVTAVAVAAGLAGCGGQSGGGDRFATSFGHMAGYVWTGNVTSVGAAWSVPRMKAGSGAAHASTWIGAQERNPVRPPPFIQVGTVEDRASSADPVYGAFWTDTTRGFHPQILFHVRPGDVVASALVLAAGRWLVSIKDTTSGRRAAFSTSEEGAASFSLAEWLQEDPSDHSGKVARYPRLSTVRMSALAVNGAPARYADVFAQWMSLPDGNLAPTPVRHDAFAITRAVLSPAGERYLEIAAPRTAAAHRIDQAAASWTNRTPAGEIRRASAAAAASAHAYADRLAQATWPVVAQGPISDLVREVGVEVAILRSAARHAPSPAIWRRRVQQVGPLLQGFVHQVRRALHLPEIVSGPLPRLTSTRTR